MIRDQSVCLERRRHWSAELFGQFDDGLPVAPCAMADDEHGASSRGDEVAGGREGVAGWTGSPVRQPAFRPARRLITRRQVLYLVRQDQVRHVPFDEGSLAGEVHMFGMIGFRLHDLRRTGDGPERSVQVDVLERAATSHLRRHLAGKCEHWSAVRLGVEQARQLPVTAA